MAEEFRVPIAIPVETNAASAADSIEGLRDSISGSKDAIKEAANQMRNLRGKSDEVKAAKDQLTTKIRAEEASVTKATLALIKQGAGLEKVAKSSKVVEKSTEGVKAKSDALAKALSTAGGPVSSLKEKLGTLKDLLGGTEGGMAAVAGIAALAAAAIVAVGVAAVGAAVSLGKFIIASADAARMMQLTRKANLNGNEDWAKNLGDQVDRLARSIPVTKEKLNELGISLAKSRIGGQTMVDTLEAVSGATAAAGDDLGNKLKGIVERGAFTRRFQLSPQELLGMDLDFDEVAKAYAEGMHVSVNRAREELVSGRVKLADGAAALKKAVNAKFGEINADKMLGLDNQLNKFKADMASLAKDVNLTPILKGIKSLADNFSQTNVNGVAMKNIITTIGKSLGVTFEEGVPILQEFIDKAVWGALKIENYWLRAKIAFRETFGGKTSLEMVSFKAILSGVVGVLEATVPGLALIVEGVKLMSATFESAKANVASTLQVFTDLKDGISNLDWSSLGSSIVTGLIDGMKAEGKFLVDTVKGLADSVKGSFKDALGIHSPSKVFEAYGKNVGAGAEQGIKAGTPAVHDAAAAMAPSPGEGGKSGGGKGAVTITFAPTIHLSSNGGDAAAQLKDPSLLQALTEAFLGQIRAAGIEVPA